MYGEYRKSGDSRNFVNATELVEDAVGNLQTGLLLFAGQGRANREHANDSRYQQSYNRLIQQYNELADMATKLMRRNDELESQNASLREFIRNNR